MQQIKYAVSISRSTVASSGVYSKPLLCSLTLPCFPCEWSICPCLTDCWIYTWNLFVQSSVDRMTKHYFWAHLKRHVSSASPLFLLASSIRSPWSFSMGHRVWQVWSSPEHRPDCSLTDPMVYPEATDDSHTTEQQSEKPCAKSTTYAGF